MHRPGDEDGRFGRETCGLASSLGDLLGRRGLGNLARDRHDDNGNVEGDLALPRVGLRQDDEAIPCVDRMQHSVDNPGDGVDRVQRHVYRASIRFFGPLTKYPYSLAPTFVQ